MNEKEIKTLEKANTNLKTKNSKTNFYIKGKKNIGNNKEQKFN